MRQDGYLKALDRADDLEEVNRVAAEQIAYKGKTERVEG